VTARVALKPLSAPAVSFAFGLAPPQARGRVIPIAPHLVARTGAAAVARAAGISTVKASSVRSPYGFRRDPFTGGGRMHTGIDIKADYGESVGASAAGAVLFAGVRGGYGNLVILDHGDGITSYYAHLSSIRVVVGETVAAGQVLGAVGSTGRSTGPHLHYEVRAFSRAVDPFAAIKIDSGRIFANGKAVTIEAIDGGDEEEPAAAATAGRGKGARRGTGKAKAPVVHQPILVVGDGSLTSY
jgi:murein DD-endopeptidase MepM/ murein hydrolase activator NlpD